MLLAVVFYGMLNVMECVISKKVVFFFSFLTLTSCSYKYSKIEISPKNITLEGIKIGSKNEIYFTIQNLSSRDLIIMDIESSCDCTIPEISKLSIPKDNVYQLKILYSPTRLGEQTQTITIKSNTDPPFHDVFIYTKVVD